MFMGRMMGMTAMNLEMALGSMMTQTISPTSWIIGFVRFQKRGSIKR